ncbi:hypothetical protein BH18ACI5_BH18ACI5_16050 [soil metagenome]
MKAAVVLAALSLALVLQSTLGGISLDAGTRVNFVLVAVIYCALSFGAMTGLLAGLAGGLAQDAIAGAVLGVGGISKTLIGFVVGVLGAQFIVTQPLTRFVMFLGASVVHEFCFQALTAVVESRGVRFQYSAIFAQAAVNGLLGILAFQIVEKTPGLMQRRDARRASFGSRRQF